MTNNWEITMTSMGVKTNDQLEIPLFWIRFSFFSHIIRSRFTEVQSTNCDFSNLRIHQFNSENC